MAGRPCSVCSSPNRRTIDSELVSGIPLAQIAKANGLSSQSLLRHRAEHLSKAVQAAAAQGRQEVAEKHAVTLLDQLHEQRRRADAILGRTYQGGDYRAALAAIRECTRLIELEARLTGELKEGATTNVNIVTITHVRVLQATIVAALAPYPEARAAVLQALDLPMVEG